MTGPRRGCEGAGSGCRGFSHGSTAGPHNYLKFKGGGWVKSLKQMWNPEVYRNQMPAPYNRPACAGNSPGPDGRGEHGRITHGHTAGVPSMGHCGQPRPPVQNDAGRAPGSLCIPRPHCHRPLGRAHPGHPRVTTLRPPLACPPPCRVPMETRNATRPPTAMAWHRGCHRQTGTRRAGCPRWGLLGAPLRGTGDARG